MPQTNTRKSREKTAFPRFSSRSHYQKQRELEASYCWSRWSTTPPVVGRDIGPDDKVQMEAALCLETGAVSKTHYRHRPRTTKERVHEMRENNFTYGKKPGRITDVKKMASALMHESIEDRQRLLKYFSNAERAEYRKLRAIELHEESKEPVTGVRERRFRRAIAALR